MAVMVQPLTTPCLKKGDLVDVRTKLYFSGSKYYHTVGVTVNGIKLRSDIKSGSDYWNTVLTLLEDRLDAKATGTPTQKLWYLRDIGVQFDSRIVNISDYNEL